MATTLELRFYLRGVLSRVCPKCGHFRFVDGEQFHHSNNAVTQACEATGKLTLAKGEKEVRV